LLLTTSFTLKLIKLLIKITSSGILMFNNKVIVYNIIKALKDKASGLYIEFLKCIAIIFKDYKMNLIA
jgi:hypothetical protein